MAPRAVVLAASRGAALGELTEDKPKCMIDVRGEPLLRRLTRTLNGAGVRNVTVVRGYAKGAINLPSVRCVDNDLYASTGEAASLACASADIRGDCVIAYGDILFRQYYLDQLLAAEEDLVVAVDALWENRHSDADGWVRDYVSCSRPFSGDYLDDDPVYLNRMANDVEADAVDGEWIGLARLSARGSDLVAEAIEIMKGDGTLQQASLLDLFSRLADAGHEVRVIYVPGQWMDVDDAADLNEAGKFL
ncbi:MAG: phosphocholine cytidylyltransferase family protein [Magnetovibrio sp.]|nr:phosphocholine cytidylyltransferase family protein [Magnetovibrio sp.]